jgi:tetratricopeptide (TPR) repeat protein
MLSRKRRGCIRFSFSYNVQMVGDGAPGCRICTPFKGAIVVQPLILQYYQLLPEHKRLDEPSDWARQYRKSLGKYKRAVEARYFESTLLRLLGAEDCEVRQATVLALGLMGSINVNAVVAKCLHDEDPIVRQLAAEGLWSIWQRGDTPENNQELQRLAQLIVAEANADEILAGFEALIRKAPRFAEAYNQRAIFHYHRGDYARAILDCEKALRLNPCHFGAASGMGQCFMKQKKLRAALRIYRRANRINPNLDMVRETIQSLERMLGEEGKR